MKNFIKTVQFVAALGFIICAFSACRNVSEISATDKLPFAEPQPTPKNTPANNNGEPDQTIEKIKIGETEIQIVTRKSANAKPLYFRPHENEVTSSDATAQTIKKYGGTFVELKSKGERNIGFTLKGKNFSIDPNRIFSAAGIEKTIGNGGGNTRTEAVKEVSNFVDALLNRFLTDKKMLIAVHNNTNGGNLSIETYKTSPDAASVYANPSRDIDDFFYVTDEKFFNFLKEKKFNVVLQNNVAVTDDGSLSVYCGKKGISYINIESEHGHLPQQIEMLEAIQEMIKNAE